MDYNQVDVPEVISNWEKWWDGELDRPLFFVTCTKEYQRKIPLKSKYVNAHYSFDMSAEYIIDAETCKLVEMDYFADAFPLFWPNFGPGVEAALVGGTAELTEETVWFGPGKFKDMDISNIAFELDTDNAWFKRMMQIHDAAGKIWGKQVIQGLTDLGGGIDVLSSFRPGERLLFDLYDHPKDVKRLSCNLNELWFECFEHFNKVIKKNSPGYSCWAGILSSGTNYMLQCDFAYMISPEMFEEFVKPDIEYACKKLDRSFYHLDGVGQLAHIQHLCS